MALEAAHCIAPSTKKVIIEQRSCVNGIHEPLVSHLKTQMGNSRGKGRRNG